MAQHKLDDFIIEYAEFEIVCSHCTASTDRDSKINWIISQAERLGFEVIEEDIYCRECVRILFTEQEEISIPF